MDGLAAACRLRGPRRHHRAALEAAGQRQNEQAFAAQSASIGASVTTAVQRMDDLTLAARTMLGSRPDTTEAEFTNWYRSMGVDQRFSGVAGFGYVKLVREAQRDIYPPGQRPYYCLPSLGIASPGMADTLADLTMPGIDICEITSLLGDTRDSGQFSVIVVTSSSGHELFEVVAPVYRGGGVPGTLDARRKQATGWIVGLFDAEPILRDAVARQTGISVTLERDHVADPGYRIPTGAGAAFRTLSETLQTSVGRALRPPRRRRSAEQAHVGRGRRPLERHRHGRRAARHG